MKKTKTIFLDRDGVINDNSIVYYIHKEEDFVFNKGVFECLKKMKEKGYQLIVITNQGGIAKKQYTNIDVQNLNKKLISNLKQENIEITEIFHCPHHSDISKCLCRKPESLLFEKAIAIYNVDIENSYMIGDSPRDIVAAEKVGIKGIKVEGNKNLLESLKQSGYTQLID